MDGGGANRAPRRLSPAALYLARLAWIALAAMALAVLVAAVPPYYRLLSTPCTNECAYFQLPMLSAQALAAAGLSLRVYALALLAQTLLTILTAWVLASVIFWLKGDRFMPAYMGFCLPAFGLAFFSVLTTALVAHQPAWRVPVAVLEGLGTWTIGAFGLIFPTGTFVPRSSWPLAVIVGVASVAIAGSSSLANMLLGQTPLARLLIACLVGSVVVSAAAQIYRYRRVSGPLERQQAKWIVFGLALFVFNGLVFVLAGRWYPPFRGPGLANALYYLLGGGFNVAGAVVLLACLALAIVRYRLWDIDVLIRRTLSYSLLTGLLALIYLASVVALENLLRAFTRQGQNELVTVISTLAIAALFVPLRARVQAFIDRSFYRRKYDAARTLAGFAASVRDEVELEALTEHLLSVVDVTMQPEQASLWLKHTSTPAMRVKP